MTRRGVVQGRAAEHAETVFLLPELVGSSNTGLGISRVSAVNFERKRPVASSSSSSPVRPSLLVFFGTAAAGRESRQFDYNPPAIFAPHYFSGFFRFFPDFIGFLLGATFAAVDSECGQHHGACLMDIARPHGQHQIAGFGDSNNLFDSFLKGGAVAYIRAIHCFHQCLRIDAGDGSFAGSINVDHANHIRSLKAIAKFMQQVARASVAMRLKQHQNALEAALTRGFQRGANFCGVMAVIIDDSDAADFSLALKATLDAAEIRQPGGNVFGRRRQAESQWQRRPWHFSSYAGLERKA